MADLEQSSQQESDKKSSSIFSKIKSYFGGKEDSKFDASRRVFLRGAVGLGAAMALNSSFAPVPAEQVSPSNEGTTLSQEAETSAAEETIEQEKNSVPLILDIFNAPAFFDKVIQEQAKTSGVDVQGVLSKFGVTESWTFHDFKSVVPENETEQKILLLTALKTFYASHGENVTAVRSSTARFLNNPEVQAEHGSIEEAFSVDFVEVDELGNPTLWLRVSPEVIDQLIAQSDESVINMSFQLGKVGIKYELYKQVRANPDARYPSTVTNASETIYYDADNNRISKEEHDTLEQLASEKKTVLAEDPSSRDLIIQDGYIKERSYDNLKLMAELAAKYPEKIIVVSAGNPAEASADSIPDFREARAKLMEEGLWPPNLFTIGFVVPSSGFDFAPAEYGADFYVWYQDLGLMSDENPASSYAAPMVTEIVRHLQSLGLTESKDIRQALIGFSTDINTSEHNTYIQGNSDQPYYMIDFEKVKREFRANTQGVKAP